MTARPTVEERTKETTEVVNGHSRHLFHRRLHSQGVQIHAHKLYNLPTPRETLSQPRSARQLIDPRNPPSFLLSTKSSRLRAKPEPGLSKSRKRHSYMRRDLSTAGTVASNSKTTSKISLLSTLGDWKYSP
jgi:hypothetical protein